MLYIGEWWGFGVRKLGFARWIRENLGKYLKFFEKKL